MQHIKYQRASKSIQEDISKYLTNSFEDLFSTHKMTDESKILILHPQLYAPYYAGKMSCDVIIYKESNNDNDGIKIEKVKIHKPYPNKHLLLATLQNGRSYCDFGIPLIFDRFEELEQLKKIRFKWMLELPSKEGVINVYLTIEYNLSFENSNNKDCSIYVINSHDQLPFGFEQEYISEFESAVVTVYGDEMASHNFREKKLTINEIENKCFDSLLAFGLEPMLKSLNCKEDEFIITAFLESTEHIIPLKKEKCHSLIWATNKYNKFCRNIVK